MAVRERVRDTYHAVPPAACCLLLTAAVVLIVLSFTATTLSSVGLLLWLRERTKCKRNRGGKEKPKIAPGTSTEQKTNGLQKWGGRAGTEKTKEKKNPASTGTRTHVRSFKKKTDAAAAAAATNSKKTFFYFICRRLTSTSPRCCYCCCCDK